ncbi:hypothetical protein ABPG75_012924 [Micractinium tetrahymenae]
MVLLLTAAEPLGGCLVGAATSSDVVIAAADGHVACYAAPHPTAASGGSRSAAPAASCTADPTAPRPLWQHRIVGGRVEHAAPLAADGSAYLLVTSHGGAAPPQAAVVTLAGPGAAPALAAHLELGGGGGDEGTGPHEEAPTHPAFSNLARCAGNSAGSKGGGFLLAASLRQGAVHIIRAVQAAGGSWNLSTAATRLCDRVTMEPGSVIVVESLALGPASARLAAGCPPHLHAAILYSSHRLGGGPRVKHVACLEVDEGQGLRSCAWFHRNVHPSTSLVAALPGARMLVGAREGLALVQADAPQDRQLVPVRLQGQPTCAAALSERLAVVACSEGQLLLLDLQRLEAAPVAAGVLNAAPTCLAFMPALDKGAGQAAAAAAVAEAGTSGAAPPAGLLFVGSGGGGSAFLELPGWRPAPAGDAAQLAASVAPISSACLFEDDSGDKRLLACCGQAPFAQLALGWLAAGLSPLASGGGDLPGLVRLLGLRASPSAPCHRYLLLSCDAAGATTDPASCDGWTMVLEAEEGELRSAAVPGLQVDAATLLASPLPGGTMLQVTPQGAAVFRPSAGGAVLSSWSPPSGAQVSLAAQQGQYLALACGALLQVLYCGGTGRLQQECQLELPQQASALTLFQLGTAGQEGGEVWLAVGLWLSNEVLLQPLSAEQPACRLALPCQPRSLAVITCTNSSSSGSSSRGGTYLVVGASSGEVLWWRLAVQRDAFGGASGVQLEECGWARAGVAPVTLHLLPPAPAASSSGSDAQLLAPAGLPGPAATSGGTAASAGPASWPTLLAVSDQALLLGPDAARPDRLAAARLHGGQGLTAACPLVTAELPDSSLAYVQGGELHIGGLDPAVRLRWDQLPLADGAEASTAVVLAGCGTAAVACAEAHGGSSLRLVEAASLHQLARLAMPPGHTITALAAAHLACSSRRETPAAGAGSSNGSGSGAGAAGVGSAPAAALAGTKEFLLVALSADNVAAVGSGQAGEEELPAPAAGEPAAAGGSQPWWRQQPVDDAPAAAAGQQGQQAGASPQPQPAAMLRVYEVRRCQHHEQTGSSGRSGSGDGGGGHELVLHGSCPLPTAVFSLAAVQPDSQSFGTWIAGTASGSNGTDARAPVEQPPVHVPAAASEPVLAAGCHDGIVRLYRVHIDDEGLEAQRAVQQGLADLAAAAVQPLRLSEEQEQRQAEDEEQGGRGSSGQPAPQLPAAVPTLSKHLWHQRVALQLVAKAPTCFEGLPTSLAVSGSTLYALDLLSSLTAFRVQPLAAGQPPRLVPLAADVAGHHVSAALPLGRDGRAALAGLASGGLLLLQRDEAAERQRHAAAKQRWDAVRESGGAGDEAAAAAAAGAAAGAARQSTIFTPSLREAVALEAVSAASPSTAPIPGPGGSSGVSAICPGMLGVPLRRFSELGELGNQGAGIVSGLGGSEGSGAALEVAAAAGEAPRLHAEPATVVCTNGGVLTARVVSPEEHRTLWQLQKAAELTEEPGGVLAVSPAGTAGGAAGPSSQGAAVDGSLLVAAYTEAAWRQRLLHSAPADAVQRGRRSLEGHGVL